MKKLLLLTTLVSFNALAGTWVVQTKRPLNPLEIKTLSAQGVTLEKFAPGHKTGEFSKMYVWSSKSEPKHQQIKKIESSFALSTQSIIPNPKGERVLSEPLFGYQWALYNQEQTLVKEEDDIRNIRLLGVRGNDLNWKNVLEKTRVKGKSPLVAIVDTGVDYNHPELVDAVIKNTKECEAEDKTKDNDGNGLPGDCLGWNFTAPLNSDAARDPMDRAGHGTHLSGIVAAKHDGKGIAGLAPDMKILAVKVINDGETETSQDGPRLAMSDRLARGIVYAVDRGADVINLSLGWPRSLETDYLRKAVSYAFSKGALLVAAAGNNNSSEPIFPCAIDGVICVGATTIDGTWAGFSNFGSSVDVLAPGEGILSTSPLDIEPELFNVPGFDIKNGTSQAAPYVTAALALLKAKHADWSLEALKAKLMASSKDQIKGSKYSSGGSLDLVKLLGDDTLPVLVRPQFKLLRQLIFAVGETEKSFQLPIKSLGSDATNVKVTIRSLSDAIEILNGEQDLGDMKSLEAKTLDIRYNLKDLNSHSQIRLEVIVSVGESSTSYFAEIPLVRDIRKDRNMKNRLFRFAGPVLPVGVIKDGIVQALVSTIDELHPSGKQEFFMRRLVTEPKEGEVKGITVTILRSRENDIVQLQKTVTIENATQLISFTRMDVNYDGVEDYFMQTLVEDESGKNLKFSYFDKNLEPLFGEDSTWTFKPEVAVIAENSLRFMAVDFKGHGKVAVPVFSTSGRLPKADQDPSPWVRSDNGKRDRIYILVPEKTSEGVVVNTRSISTIKFLEETLKKFGFAWDERVDYLDMLSQSQKRFQEGKVDILFSIGRGVFRKLKKLTLSTPDSYEWSDYAQDNVRLEGMTRQNLLDLNGEDFYRGGDVFAGFYDSVTAKILAFTGNVKPTTQTVIRHDSKLDSLLNHLGSYKEDSGWSHFMQTKSKLLLVRQKGSETKKFTRPILRFSFLPGKMLSELYYPIYVKSNDVKQPALYVDSTQITANRVHVLVSNDEGLTAPARFSIFVPNNCKALNPQITANKATFQYNLLCAEADGWTLKSLELK
ncbi:MAG: S8 family serine peptidase [Bacteriovoracaceae bacterium]|nr:S8 family serine peptidase [Bacteriovoracaceae bacterium]